MRELHIKSFVRLFVSSIISSLMLINSSIALAFNDQISNDELLQISKTINSKKFSYKELVSDYQKYDVVRAKELESIFLANPQYQSVQIPKSTVEDGKLSFMIEGKKSLFSIDKQGRIDILIGDKKILLEYSMSPEQMIKKISDSLNEKKYSFVDFFIQKSYANPLDLVLVAVIVWWIAGLYHEVPFVKVYRAAKKLCDAPTEATTEAVDSLKKAFDYLTVNAPEKCVGREVKSYVCKEIPSIKKCLKDKIDQIKNGAIDDSSRSQIKEKQQMDESTKHNSEGAVQK
jgi:hypothetical protein